jgi:hypothetical protein
MYPFKDGFNGYVTGKDEHPWTFKFNLQENYFNQRKEKKSTKQVKLKESRKR